MAKRGKTDEDISKKTIAVLLMITLVLSAIGTWLMVTSKPEAVVGMSEGTPTAGGKISFAIYDKEQPEATGLISYEILEG